MAEPITKSRPPQVDDPVLERGRWVQALTELVAEIEGWARRGDWSTRVVEKPLTDSILGEYNAPGLLLQREFTRVLLDPITRFAPRTEGVVDLYLMPAYTDIATLYRTGGEWLVHYAFQGDETLAGLRNNEPLTLTEENFGRILNSIAAHAA